MSKQKLNQTKINTKNNKQFGNFEKKAQTEMFGLIFIVFLISIGLIFLVQSEINRKPSTIKQSFEKSELATNTINTLIKTRTLGCNNLDLSDLYIDCAKNKYSPRITCENGKTSCEFLETTTNYILINTLELWNKEFFLNMSVNSETIYTYASSGVNDDNICPLSDRKVESIPLPLNPGTLLIEMWICG